ncbi:exendin-4-like [Tiliqua scincoides]|uniref:exendin-4-like n=1 Tax=Tiliqua scincoides TaxID=71010 RepID=UPI003462CE51
MRNLTWLCVMGLLVVTLLPGSWQMAVESGSHLDDYTNDLEVHNRIKRHGEGSYTSDVANNQEQLAIERFLNQLKNGQAPR